MIYKYQLKETGLQTIILPYDSRILSIQDQSGALTLWAMFDENIKENPEERLIFIAGTGHDFDMKSRGYLEFISTVQMSSGLVWHVFEVER